MFDDSYTQTIVKALVTYKTFMKVRIETLNIDGKCVTDPQDIELKL